jgi:hypothetical protein
MDHRVSPRKGGSRPARRSRWPGDDENSDYAARLIAKFFPGFGPDSSVVPGPRTSQDQLPGRSQNKSGMGGR